MNPYAAVSFCVLWIYHRNPIHDVLDGESLKIVPEHINADAFVRVVVGIYRFLDALDGGLSSSV